MRLAFGDAEPTGIRIDAERLRAEHATPLLRELRAAVGLRDLSHAAKAAGTAATTRMTAQFKQYREADGRFYFKLIDADGKVLLQSIGHQSARDAGQLIAKLKHAGAADGLRHVETVGVYLDDTLLGELATGVAIDEVVAALASFAEDAA